MSQVGHGDFVTRWGQPRPSSDVAQQATDEDSDDYEEEAAPGTCAASPTERQASRRRRQQQQRGAGGPARGLQEGRQDDGLTALQVQQRLGGLPEYVVDIAKLAAGVVRVDYALKEKY